MATPQGCQVETEHPAPTVGLIAGVVVQHRQERMPTRGGHECEFIHPPLNFPTECAICLLVLRSPHITSCCGHNFCKECIERVQKAGKCCPLCNKDNFTLTYNRAHDVSLQQFEVYCPHHKIGCEWRGKLEMLDTHLNVNPKLDKQLEGCAFVEVQCYNDGCGLYYQRRCIVEHQCRACPLRVFSCEHCHEYESTYHDVTTNHWPVCKCYPLPCPHECRQETIQRQNLEQHLNEECPLQEVECEFKYAGCEAKLPRKDMPDHLTKDNVRHMTLLAQQNQTLARQNQELMSKLLEKDEQLRKMIEDDLVGSIAKLMKLQQENTETLARQNEEVTAKLRELEEQVEAQAKRSSADMQEMRQTVTEIKEGQNAMNAVNMDALDGRITELQSKTAPIQIVMANYERHKRDNDRWYSDGFYTHSQGCKMCLSVHANGAGKSEGTHVSCYIYLMRGEFDNNLKWPFRGAVTITLLNQREDNHHLTHTVSFHDQTPNHVTARVTSGERAAIGPGQHRFIPLSELGYNRATKRQYLVNSCLYFRVKVEMHTR